jgi:hypothetical protein
MIALFFLLLLSNLLLGTRRTTKIVQFLDVPCGFSLRWLNLLFTPSFITLPLYPIVPFPQAMRVAAMFGMWGA